MVIQCAFKECRPYLNELEARFGLAQWAEQSSGFSLHYDDKGLSLYKTDEPKLGAINVDFVTGAVAHRRKFGGGKGQSIAKAVGLNKGATPVVLDATAGLGRDGFVLASLGCKVILHERHPVVAALLYDGLQRAYNDSEIGPWMQQNMSLIFGSSHTLLAQCDSMPDVVYLDPMFPHREKSALVKKEMRVFQELVGGDTDADDLLDFAYPLASKRVVVKRPDYAPFLNDKTPSMQIKTKKNRFDVYVKAAMV
ncbi:16S rRNA (guanine1516-N2)-methyltransferase [Pseudoalteromonas undina]|uniref:Ribosomal RNA small subunit methyltransferase J n=1 Tax=Pseudoalteromonas undina TaxID=43660 RepID=A0ABN0NFI2_9GAMM|nr:MULTISPECIES: class I SAM-dependent methyltransferase [Pseudoalteromonas]KAF7769358.1 16S rRNA (guanine1516-N2)-methyltransferase [Pseudoalteromonas undina]KPZ63427.1 Ribosomal RNA small subunit methyltransferase J [Pseudoalteromonas sp. P1-16-1b]TMP51563.1 16S rRNA methyltransferase [Pseudoalteromonas sp. S1612]TMP56382.1 16S rRNA methyltransferase [Pseudoalteromonas sp. S1610]TMP68192.1 16S rRNA methyltransferase [Pseudoalteromonas sp. S1609]